MDAEDMVRRMIRTGTVSALQRSKRTACVTFDGSGIVSAPLKILQSPPFIPAQGAAQRTQAEGGGMGEAAFSAHSHGVTISPWLPDVGARVLCLCLPNDAGDGFILGGL